MIKPLEITKAEHLEGYRLLVWFNDGAIKVIDLAGVSAEATPCAPKGRWSLSIFQTRSWHDHLGR